MYPLRSATVVGLICMVLLVLTILASAITPGPLLAQTLEQAELSASPVPTPARPLEALDSIGGRMADVLLHGSVAYITEGPALVVLDVSNRNTPQPIFRLPLLTSISDLKVSGTSLYALSKEALYLFDVTNPRQPTLRTRYPLAQYGWAYALAGGFAYVSQASVAWDDPGPSPLKTSGVLEVIDLRNPDRPIRAGMLPMPRAAYAVEAGTGFIYLGAAGSMLVVDVRNPNKPQLRGTPFNPTGNFTTVRSIAITGNHAYIMGVEDPGSAGFGMQLHAVNISNPDKPTQVVSGNVYSAGSYHLFLAGNKLYLSTSISTRDSEGVHKLQVFDISTPTKLVEVKSFNVVATDFVVTNDYIYLINDGWEGEEGFYIAQMTASDALQMRGSYRRTMPHKTHHYATLENGHISIVQDDALYTVDIQDPRQLNLQHGEIDIKGRLFTIEAERAYSVSSGWLEPSLKLHLYDLSDPATPQLLNSYTVFEQKYEAKRIAVVNGFAYICAAFLNSTNEFHTAIVDVRDPSAPMRVSHTTNAPNCDPHVVVGNVLYTVRLSTTVYELITHDLNPPNEPPVRTRFNLGGGDRPTLLAASGNRLYLQNGFELITLDISTPHSPRLLGRFTFPYAKTQNLLRVQIFGNRAYVGNSYLDQTEIWDLSNPTMPSLRASTRSVDEVIGVVDDVIFASPGVQAIRIHPEHFPSPIHLPMVPKS